MTAVETRDLLWLGGLFDGEGGITIYRRSKNGHDVRVTLTNTSLPGLLYVRATMGLGGVLATLRRSSCTHRACYQLSWTGRKGEQLLRLLVDHLRIKKGEVELALRFRETFNRTAPWPRRLKPGVAETRECLMAELKVMRSPAEKKTL